MQGKQGQVQQFTETCANIHSNTVYKAVCNNYKKHDK